MKIKLLLQALALRGNSQRALFWREVPFFASIVASAFIVLSPKVSHATLLSYESFDYATGNLAGQNGGTGFTGAWATVGDSGAATVQANSLAYSTLSTTGNKTYLLPTTQTSGASRTFSDINSGSLYMSFLANLDEGNRFFAIRLYDGSAQRALVGRLSTSNWMIQSTNGGNVNGFTAIAPTLDTTFLIVLRIDFNASGDNERLRLYVNPTPGGTEPVTAGADITSLASFQINRLDIAAGYTTGGASTTAKGWFDEIRMGTTYADVTPIPEPSTMALFGGAAALLLLRRRRKVS